MKQAALIDLEEEWNWSRFFVQGPPESPVAEGRHGALFRIDAVDFLSTIQSESVDLVFADPPYNIGKAEWDEFKDMNEYISWVDTWVSQAERILKPTGSCYIMGFPEILADLKQATSKHFSLCRWLVWHYRNKPILSEKDWVRSHEAILHLRKTRDYYFDMNSIREPYNVHTRKYPERPQGASSQYGSPSTDYGRGKHWSPNPGGAKPRDVICVPTLNNSMAESTDHPAQKPEELLRRLVLASSAPGDVVVDPFGGSGTTFVVCEQLRRNWLGSEISDEYCAMAATRLLELTGAPEKPPEYWLETDWKRQANRHKVRYGRYQKEVCPSKHMP